MPAPNSSAYESSALMGVPSVPVQTPYARQHVPVTFTDDVRSLKSNKSWSFDPISVLVRPVFKSPAPASIHAFAKAPKDVVVFSTPAGILAGQCSYNVTSHGGVFGAKVGTCVGDALGDALGVALGVCVCVLQHP